MKNKSLLFRWLIFLLVAMSLLAGCGGEAAQPTAEPTLEPEPTLIPIPTQDFPPTNTPDSPLPTLESNLPTEEGGELLPEDDGLPTEEGGDELFPEGDEFPTEEGQEELFPSEEDDGVLEDDTEDTFGDEELGDEFSEGEEEPLFLPTPSDIPLGQPGNPLILGVVATEENLDQLDSSQLFIEQISELTGYSMDVLGVNSTTELLNGMQIGAIHMAWMQPFTYILASRRGYARVTLVTKHFGVYAYGTQFLANANSDIIPYFDTTTNTNTAEAAEALSQFAELRPCWVDPLSASGYVVPAGALALQEVPTQPALFMQSHTAVVRGLYVQGICDFGATYSVYGDPRTASVIQDDLPDVMQRVVVVWKSGEVIPNLNFSFQSEVPEEIVEAVTETLMDYVLSQDGLDLVNAAAGYEIEDFKQIDDSFYDPLRDLLQYSRVNLRTLVGK